MTTHLLSANHRLPDLDIVARLGAVAPRLRPDLLGAVPTLYGVLVLSTYSRLALLIDADSRADTGCSTILHPDLRPADAGQSVAAPDLGETITAFPVERAGLPASGFLLTHLIGAAARREMFAITAGLSSMVVGETQIVSQVRRIAGAAATKDMLSPELVRVIERASATAYRVAHETELSDQGRSVVAIGVNQAAGRLPPLEDCRALIVDTGSYTGAAVVDLHTQDLTDITVYSTSNRAEAFAADHDLRAVPTGTLNEAISRTDLVVTCRDTGGSILTADVVAPIAAERTGSAEGVGHPLVVLGLALTRDVDEAVDALPGVVRLDLAHVRGTVSDAEARQVTTACAIVEAEAADLGYTLTGWAMGPLITTLRARVGRIITEEAARLRLQPTRRLALVVPAVDGRAGTDVSGINSVDTAAGACLHHRLAASPGFGVTSEIDGEPMVPLTQAERALHHLATRLPHQPTVMARRADQEGCEEAYRQALKLAWGLENTGEDHD